MVWSMKVIATAKIIAVKTSVFDRTPVPAELMALITFSWLGQATAQADTAHGAGTRSKSQTHSSAGPNNAAANQSPFGGHSASRGYGQPVDYASWKRSWRWPPSFISAGP